MINKFFVLLSLILLVSCNNKDSGCTEQSGNTIIVSCISYKKDGISNNCLDIEGPDQTVCELGADVKCQPYWFDPYKMKAQILGSNSYFTLINKLTGKRMVLKEKTTSTEDYIYVQHIDDPGETSSVNLPVCAPSPN